VSTAIPMRSPSAHRITPASRSMVALTFGNRCSVRTAAWTMNGISGAYESVGAMVAARDALSPTGQMGTAIDVANAAVFLASDESRYINGICLPVDGGLVQSLAPPAR